MFDTLCLMAFLPASGPSAAPLHLASLAALYEAQVPGARVNLSSCRPVPSEIRALELFLVRERPRVLGLWWDAEDEGRLEALLSRLSPVLGDTRFLALGPAVDGPEEARRLLQRVPALSVAVAGDAEAPLLMLVRAWVSDGASSDPLPQGVVERRGRTLVVGTAPPPTVEGRRPSPWLERRIAARPGEDVFFELGVRTSDPQVPGGVRFHPMDRLAAELDLLLEMTGVGSLNFLPRDLADDGFTLRKILTYIARSEHRARLNLSLAQLPGHSSWQLLREAGVARLSVPDAGLRSRRGRIQHKQQMFRAILPQLRDQGLRAEITLPVGRPDDSAEDLRHAVDLLVNAGVGRVLLEPLHGPDLKARRALRRRGATLQDRAPWEVLQTRAMGYDERTVLLRQGEQLGWVMPTYAASLRTLARQLREPPLTLVSRLVEAPGPRPRGADPLDGDLWATFAAELLRTHQLSDLVPPLLALIEFEAWVATASRPNALPPAHPWRGRPLDEIVPVLHPAASVGAFSYDVVGLQRGGSLEGAAVRASHVLMRWTGRGAPVTYTLTELQLEALRVVDGARPVGLLVEILQDHPSFIDYHEGVVAAAYSELLAMGALYAAGTVSQPPEPALRSNVLLFPGVKGHDAEGEGA